MYDLAVGHAARLVVARRWASAGTSPASQSIAVEPHWWLAALFTGLGAAVGEAAVPVVRVFIGQEQRSAALRRRRRRRRRRGDGPQPPARAGRTLVHAHQAPGVARAEGTRLMTVRHDSAADSRARLGRWLLTSAPRASASWPSSPSCCSAPSAPASGSCRPCRPTRCRQTVDQNKIRTIPLVPERGRIFDVDGRILADNDRLLTRQRRLGGDPRATPTGPSCSRRLSGWLQMPVEEMEARYDSRLYSRYRPMPVKEDVDENVAIAIEERREDFPGCRRSSDVAAGLSVRPAGQPRRRLHGLDHRRGRRALRGARLRHARAARRRPQRHRAEHGVGPARRVGRAQVVRGRQPQPHRARDQPARAGQRQGHAAVDRPRPAAVRRAAAADAAPPAAAQFTANNPMVARISADGTEETVPLDPTRPAGAAVPYKAPAGSVVGDELPDRPDRGDGELPDVRQPVVQLGRRQRQVRRAVPPAGRGRPAGRPRPVEPDQPRHPGPVQPGLDVQAFVAYAGAGHRAAQPGEHYYDEGTYTMRSIDAGARAPRACAACTATRRARTATSPVQYGNVDVARRWPCRATPSTTSSARTSTSRRARRCRTRSASSVSAPTRASTCRSSSTVGSRRTS